ncbi:MULTISPECIES: hypothetical protein [Salinibaculum]|uniref:hypothetical protein n=1 Tax=Salinibaculum TaxID=2732368 RepID=UPI0030D3D505
MATNESITEERIDTSIQPASGDRTRVSVAGGVLVYERRAVGKELVGFEAVDDWDDLANDLAVRGHNRGAIYHLPEFDA